MFYNTAVLFDINVYISISSVKDMYHEQQIICNEVVSLVLRDFDTTQSVTLSMEYVPCAAVPTKDIIYLC
jgi:hypothetical protein